MRYGWAKIRQKIRSFCFPKITTDKFFCFFFFLAYVLLNSDLPVRRTGLPVILSSVEESALTLIKVLSLTPGLQRVQRTKKQVNWQGGWNRQSLNCGHVCRTNTPVSSLNTLLGWKGQEHRRGRALPQNSLCWWQRPLRVAPSHLWGTQRTGFLI